MAVWEKMPTFDAKFINQKAVAYSHYYVESRMLHGSSLHLMGTGLDALILGKDVIEAEQIWTEIIVETERLHRMCNRFDESSELSAINRRAKQATVTLNTEWCTVLSDLKRYFELTMGYFDATCNSDTCKDDGITEIYGGFDRVDFDESRSTLRYCTPELTIDLGGYAKGYALQRMRTILEAHGVTQALINFGNSAVLALGNHPHGNAWPIGVTNPYLPYRTLKTFALSDITLSTSGNTSRNCGHIVNPHTKERVTAGKLVTVLSTDCIKAEVLSTALMAADDAAAMAFRQVFTDCRIDIFKLHS